MPKFVELWPSQFVSADEIELMPEEKRVVTIKKVYKKKVKNPEGVEKAAVLFDVEEFDRPLLMCKTAGRTVQSLYGDEAAEWIGKRIKLTTERGFWFGKWQLGVRVAPMKPTANNPKATRQAEEQRKKARELALALVEASPTLDAWYEAGRSGEGISRQDLADQVIEDVKRFGLKLSCTPEELLAKLDPEAAGVPAAGESDRQPGDEG